ncbi:DEAD/DEAH box helicase, partial [Bacteroidales bacterium OttesenSCG-928-A14]|nr:DEAD/DEAH box helicase [Bacteroidales bacterium OttesenSCG-928-A14]
MLSLLEKSGVISIFDKNSSFDRLFPNQDYLSGKGFGNLIALPFYKPALEQGNSCFIDVKNYDFQPFPDQLRFLSLVKRVELRLLDKLYDHICENSQSHIINDSDQLHIKLSNDVRLNRCCVSIELINFIKEELNVANLEYFIKNHLKKNTWNTRRYFNFVEENENEVVIPRGFIGNLLRYCKQRNILYHFLDERKKLKNIQFSSSINLLPHQKTVMDVVKQKEFGVIVMPPGSGKTVIGLKIIEEKQQPALILVHRKQLLEQWTARVETFLGIPKKEIGHIGKGKNVIGKAVTIATIQSLGKYMENNPKDGFVHSFGLIIFDECHHIPAETYRNTLSKFNSYYQYGLTATPFRKNNDTKVIFNFIGDQIVEIKPQDITSYKKPLVVIRKTQLDVPHNSKTDEFEIVSKILIHDSERNKLIVKDIHSELEKNKRVVVITERKEHIEILSQFLKHSIEVITLSGDDSEKGRTVKWKQIEAGNYQVLITTGQFFGEGTDLRNASSLVLAYPFSFKGKLIQYIGRVQRSEHTPVIYDYHDYKIDYLNKLFLKRNKHYRFFDKQATLFDDVERTSTKE